MIGETRDHFESRLDSEILRSEMLRATLLGAFFVAALGFWIILAVAFPGIVEHVFHRQLSALWVFVFIVSATLYEFGVRILMGHIIRRGSSFPVWMRYVNALVETSLPTIMLVIYAQTLGPASSLSSPWSLTYFVIILLHSAFHRTGTESIRPSALGDSVEAVAVRPDETVIVPPASDIPNCQEVAGNGQVFYVLRVSDQTVLRAMWSPYRLGRACVSRACKRPVSLCDPRPGPD